MVLFEHERYGFTFRNLHRNFGRIAEPSANQSAALDALAEFSDYRSRVSDTTLKHEAPRKFKTCFGATMKWVATVRPRNEGRERLRNLKFVLQENYTSIVIYDRKSFCVARLVA